MTTGMRISELARRSGVPASTLRYYGQLGLLPADRTAAGYRLYDEAAHQRLMFIEAAKRLRLPLPAIADLLAVWQSDACRAVKDQLRPLLDERLTRPAWHVIVAVAAFLAALAGAVMITLANRETPMPTAVPGDSARSVSAQSQRAAR